MKETIQVTRTWMPTYEEYCQEIKSLWGSRWLTNMGEKHQALQTELARYLGVEQVELLTNGHMAIELTLQALGIEGEVITTPYTFISTTQAIVRGGMTPVFCDIDPETFNIDAGKIEALITPRTRAILPVHVYGTPCEVEAIEEIGKRHGLKVVYDGAHAFGVTYRKRGIGTFGDATCFSFHATKVFHTVEGGAVCFRDEAARGRLVRLKNFGLEGEDARELGANAKMNEFCAAMGLCNLRHIGSEIEKRRKVVERYRTHLEGVPGLKLIPELVGVEGNYAYFPVVIDEGVYGASRDSIQDALGREGVQARKYFYPLTSGHSCYGGRFDPEQTPIAQRISREVLCMPLYGDLGVEEVDRICEIVLRNGRQA